MRAVAPLCPWAKKDRNACLWRQGPSCPAGRGKIAGPGPRNSERRAPAGERLSGRGETGWLARTQGGREPQRGSMPVRSTGEDSRPTEDNARRPVSPRPAPLWAELPANADASTVEVAYTGAMHAVVAAGMEDIEKGYSHMMHFVTPQSLQLREQLARVPARLPASFARPSLKFSRSNTFDSTGVMVGTQEADMQFPAGTSFTPYMVLRNNTASAP